MKNIFIFSLASTISVIYIPRKSFLPGPIEITAIRIRVPYENIDYSMPITTPYRIDKGNGMHIIVDKTADNLRSSFWKGDRIALSRQPNGMTIESATIGGEGRIQVSYSAASANQVPTYDYFLKDHLGSTRMVLNEIGGVDEAIMYQPYGVMSDPVGISSSALAARDQFTGKEFDEDGADAVNGVAGIKSYYFGARFYDPEVGVWNGVDPADEFWNSYSYVGGNPLNLVDPNGEEVADDAVDYGTNQVAMAFAASDNFFLALLYEWMIESSIKFNDLAFGIALFAGQMQEVQGEMYDANWRAFDEGDFSGMMPMGGVLRSLKAAKLANSAYSAEKSALVEMAKQDLRNGINKADMQAYKDLNKQLKDPFAPNQVRGPEVHPNRGPAAQKPHGHVGPVKHIPIR